MVRASSLMWSLVSLSVGMMRTMGRLTTFNCCIANAAVFERVAYNLLESVVMAQNLDSTCENKLNSIVMAQHFKSIYYSSLIGAILLNFRVNFVVVASNKHVTNCVSSSDFDPAVVTSNDDLVARLHKSYTDAVIGDIDRVLRSSISGGSSVITTSL